MSDICCLVTFHCQSTCNTSRTLPEIHSAIRKSTSKTTAVLISTQHHYLGTPTPKSLSRPSHWSLEGLKELHPLPSQSCSGPLGFYQQLHHLCGVSTWLWSFIEDQLYNPLWSTSAKDLKFTLSLLRYCVPLKVPCAPQPSVNNPVSHVHLSLPVNYSMVVDSLAIDTDTEFFFCWIQKEHSSGAPTIFLLSRNNSKKL